MGKQKKKFYVNKFFKGSVHDAEVLSVWANIFPFYFRGYLVLYRWSLIFNPFILYVDPLESSLI